MQGSQSGAHGSALPFAALNGALASNVACVVIPPGVHVAQPLHILYLSTGMCRQHELFSRCLYQSSFTKVLTRKKILRRYARFKRSS